MTRTSVRQTPRPSHAPGILDPVLLLEPLENLVQWRFLAFGGGVSRLGLASACVAPLRVVLIGGGHDIAHMHIPGAIPELAHLADIHPVPAIAHRDFIVRADSDAFTTLLQDHLFSWTDRPFPHPFLSVGPQAQGNFIAPVVDHLHFAPRPIRTPVGECLTRSRLTNSQQRREHQEKSPESPPSHPLGLHTVSSFLQNSLLVRHSRALDAVLCGLRRAKACSPVYLCKLYATRGCRSNWHLLSCTMTRTDHLGLGIKRCHREPCRDRGVLDSGMSQPILHRRQISTGIEHVRCHCMLQNVLKTAPATNALMLHVMIIRVLVCKRPLLDTPC